MKNSLPQLLLGCCCAFTLLVGCRPMAGTFPNGYPRPQFGYPRQPVTYPGQPIGYPRQPGLPVTYPRQPIGYPGQPIGYPTQPTNPQPYPGETPWYEVGYRPIPGRPGVPIVMNPDPFPGIPTTPPDTTFPGPGTPTIPVPRPPTEPTDNVTDFWTPWPLPPRGNQLAARNGVATRGVVNSRGWQPGGLFGAATGKPTRYVRPQQNSGQSTSTPSENLKYRGGKIIRDLYYVNLYVSGDTEWSSADVESIDGSLAAAMRDPHLNNVLLQYFNNQTIRSTPLPSHPLVGYTPKTVTRGDIQTYVTHLLNQGFLDSYDLGNTAFNLLLPRGTVLTAEATRANSVREDIDSLASGASGVVPGPEDGDSRNGMGGYHGSVVTANGGRVYFSVGVYSERLANDQTNGIPVFREPWKNVVATFYHQLAEVRTNPDVEDAMRGSSDLNADSNLGWVSDAGHEIGDFVLQSDIPLISVIKEVPLADGRGMVPVQLPYSNYAQGPEGPIAEPHPQPIR